MKERGLTLVELLVAIIISSIVLTAMAGLFFVSNRAFRTGRDVSEMSEDVRNAITTLEFVFSRWGVGVPCVNINDCQIQNNVPDCVDTNITDPMCITISQNQGVIFYASLYGIGFVQSISGNNANIVSCRLSTADANQNCYYVWNGGKPKTGVDNRGMPLAVRLPNFSGQPDCLNSPGVNLTIDRQLTTITGNQNIPLEAGDYIKNIPLEAGDYITRAPHRITLSVRQINQEYWLVMDRVDMSCGDNAVGENAVRIGRVPNPQSFQVQKIGRSVRVDVTFLSADGRTYQITRFYGR